MKEFLEIQKKYLIETISFLKGIDENILNIKPGGKWSIKEVTGHLIDSASNNHQRFIRAQLKDDLIFDGYNQNEWVSLQNYNSADWNELINCWANFNFIIINAISNIPEEKLSAERKNHNLDKIAWTTVPLNIPSTLEYFIKDYYSHLRHHINQIKRIKGSLQNEPRIL